MMYQTLKTLVYNDKVCHVLVAYTIMITIYLKTSDLRLSILLTALLGIFKEILDIVINHHAWLEASKDFLSDLVGMAIAFLVIGG